MKPYLLYTLFTIVSSVDDGQYAAGLDHPSPEYSHGVVTPPVFRLGSGAVVALATTDPLSSLNEYHSYLHSYTLKYFTLIGAAIAAVLILMLMLPGYRGNHAGGNNRDYQYRVPLSWSPETVHLPVPRLHD